MTRAHGWDRNLSNKDQILYRKNNDIEDFYSKYTFYDLAFNVRPTEINGFLGNLQLKFWNEIVRKRFSNFQKINDVMLINNDLIDLNLKHMSIVSSFAIPIITKSKELQVIYRNKFTKAEIEIRPMIAGNMSSQPFFKKYIRNNTLLPNAEFIHNNSFYCGNNPDMTKKELLTIANVISN